MQAHYSATLRRLQEATRRWLPPKVIARRERQCSRARECLRALTRSPPPWILYTEGTLSFMETLSRGNFRNATTVVCS